MKRMRWFVVMTFAFCLTALSVSADVKLPAVFGDQMVLQQHSSVSVWGWAETGEKVTVKGSWQWFGASTTADKDGHWRVRLNTPRAGGPYTVSIKGTNEIVLNDILIGEVWVCSGQSNMEWTMEMLSSEDNRKAAAEADFPRIRLFNVPRVFNAGPQSDCRGQWQVCTPETVKRFSAVGYYFGRELNEKLNEIGRASCWVRVYI